MNERSHPRFTRALLFCAIAAWLTGCSAGDAGAGAPVRSDSSVSIASIAPATGSVVGGTRVTLKGAKFDIRSRVRIGSAPCESLSIIDEKTLTCSTTAHLPGPADVEVTNPDGRSATLKQAFQYTSYLLVTNPLGGNVTSLRLNGPGNVPGAIVGHTEANTYPCLGTFAVNRRYFYAPDYNNKSITGFTVNSTTGELTRLSVTTAQAGAKPLHLVTDPGSRFLFAADQETNQIFVYSIRHSDGSLTPVAGSPFATGAGPAYLLFNAQYGLLYVANQVAGTLSTFSVDPSTGSLTALQPGNVPAGEHPITLAMHPSGLWLYAATWASGDIRTFRVDALTGLLAPVGLPTSTGGSARGLVVHPSGRTLFVSNSERTNDVRSFRIDAVTGLPVPSGHAPRSVGTLPLQLSLDPTGTFLRASSLFDNSITTFAVDGNDGALVPSGPPLALPHAPFGMTYF